MKKRGKESPYFIDRTGERYFTNEGYWLTIIAYRKWNDIDIQFDGGCTLYNRVFNNIKKGQIKNPYHPSVYGKGFLGEGRHLASIKRKHTKMNDRWSGILQRCYSLKSHLENPTYKECSVADEWHNFQVFGDWFEENYKEGFDIDKDILLKGNKIYSPETCCFVPHEINLLFVKNDVNRGECIIGVNKNKDKFDAYVSRGMKYPDFLGTFDTEEEAFQAYKKAKEAWIKVVANKWRGQITEPCYWALINYKVETTD